MNLRQRLIRHLIVAGVSALGVLAALTPWRLGVAVGGWLGSRAWRGLPSVRRLALEHLTVAFPAATEQERDRIGQGALTNLGRAAMELLMLSSRPRDRVERWCAGFDGEDRLREALSSGRGVIFVTAHAGNWELLGALLARRGYPITVVATPVYDERLDQRLVAARAAHGIETISRGRASAARQLLSSIRRNAVLGMLIDQDTNVGGAFVPFFGRLAYTPTGPAAFALRTGAVVVCGFLVREGALHHRIVVEGPIELIRTGDPERDAVANTARLTELIERHIRAHPDQWVWFHRRWRRQPPAEPGDARTGDALCERPNVSPPAQAIRT